MTHIAVLMGGWSMERDVSLVTGAAVADVLKQSGFRVSMVDVERNLPEILLNLRPDVAFNALHGRYGEDGAVQGLLEVMRVPYTHSGVLASALAMNKSMAKKAFTQAGILCTEGTLCTLDELRSGNVIDPPYVVKPVNEGSSFGVHLVFDYESGSSLWDTPWSFGDHVLVEKYVPGREITVAVMGEEALGVTEIRSKHSFFDYEAKYQEGKALHLLPAPLPNNKYQEVLDISLTAHRALGCRGVSRADFRYDDKTEDGKFYLMELNTQPGFTPISLVPEIAAHAGLSFEEVVGWIVEDAGCDR